MELSDNGFMRLKNVALSLIAVNVTVFILQQVLGNSFTEAFLLISSDIWHRPWILLTSMFLHGSFNHILFNMYGLMIFGPLLEQKIGSKRFLTIYLFSGLVAALLSSLFYARALGASGAIMGIIGALVVLMPDLRLLLFFIIPMPLWMAGIVWIAIDAWGVLVPSGVANIAHLIGMGTGMMYALYIKKEGKKYQKKFSKKDHLDEIDIEEYMKSGRI